MCQPANSVSRTKIRSKNPALASTGARRGTGLQGQKAYSRELAILPKWSTIGTRIIHVPCFEFLFIYILVWSCYEGRTYKGLAYPCSVASNFQVTFSLSLSLRVFWGIQIMWHTTGLDSVVEFKILPLFKKPYIRICCWLLIYHALLLICKWVLWSIGISQGTIWLGPFLRIFPIFWISLACKFSNTKYIWFSSWNTLVMNEAFGVFATLHLLDSERTSNCWQCFN